jgi:O-antigen ligase
MPAIERDLLPRSLTALHYQAIKGEPILLPAAAMGICVGMLAGGFNSVAGSLEGCLIACLLALVAINLSPPSPTFWRRTAGPFLCIGAAFLWASLPLLLPGIPTLAPDLLPAGLLGLCGYGLILLAGCHLGYRRASVALLVDWLLACGAAILVVGLLSTHDGDSLSWGGWQPDAEGRFLGTLRNANVTGAYAGGLAVLALGRATMVNLRSGGTAVLRAASYWLVIILALGVCIITASRSAMLLTGGAFAIMIAFGLHLRIRRRTALTSLFACAAIGTLLIVALPNLLVERFENMVREAHARLGLWQRCVELVKQAPFHGYGLGSFPILNARSLPDAQAAQEFWTVNSAHNIFLQLAIDGGLPFLLLSLLAAALIVRPIVKRVRARGTSMMMLSIMLSIAIMVGNACVDIALDVPATILWTLFLAGLVWGYHLARGPLPVSRTQGVPSEHERPVEG